MRIIRRCSVLLLLLLTAMISIAPVAEAKKAGRIEAPLSGSASYSSAKGKARYSNQSGEREFQVEVENLARLKGQTLKVFVDGKTAGSVKVSSLGAARLNLNSERGNTVPAVHTGSRVEIKTQAGTLVAAGRFP